MTEKPDIDALIREAAELLAGIKIRPREWMRHDLTKLLESRIIPALRRARGEIERLGALQNSLYDAIAHGDADHRAWLRAAIAAHFAGEPIPAIRGQGNAEAEIERLARERDKALISAERGESLALAAVSVNKRNEALEADNAKLRAVLKKCAEFFAGTDGELEAEIAIALAPPKP